jgi:hypothetical protein
MAVICHTATVNISGNLTKLMIQVASARHELPLQRTWLSTLTFPQLCSNLHIQTATFNM